MKMEFFSVSDKKPMDTIYVMLNSIKRSKQDDTTINYYLLIEDLDNKVEQYFEDLQSPDFNIIFLNARDYSKYINPPAKTYLYYVRCLAPRIFSHLEKIVYLDTDVVCINENIEDLWNIDLTNKYLAAAIDIEQSLRDQTERINVGKDSQNNNYFNTGVMIMNLSKWREDGYDKQIEDCLLNWPKELKCILYDQTLLNWIFKQNVKIISSKFNNSIFACTKLDEVHYWKYYGTQNLMDKMKDVILLHYKGVKPWYGCLSPWQEWQLPYRAIGKSVYFQLYHELSKAEEF